MYIAQGYKSEYSFWKYIIIPGGFIGLMILNFLAIELLNLDVDAIMKSEIERKGSSRFLVEMLIPFAVGLGLLFFWVKFIHKQSITALTTSRKAIDWKRVGFAFVLWGSFTSVMLLIDYNMSPEDYQWNFDLSKFLVLLVIATLLIPLQTSFEEYLFRGYLMQGIGIAVKNKWVPLIVTSFIFGIMHIANPEVEKIGYIIMVYYIGTGLFLGILTLMDEGMELALGFHAANNLITALLVTANWTAFQTDSVLKDMSEPAAGFDVLLPVFVIFPLLLIVFSKTYKWTNWKDKLTGKVTPESE
ncbi:MAG: lysostaphin resistance A-like protein [Flavobacteriaceae bacterium]